MFVRYFTIVSQEVTHKSIVPIVQKLSQVQCSFIAPVIKSYRKCDIGFSKVPADGAMMACVWAILCISSRSEFRRSGRSQQQCMCLRQAN